MFQLALLLFCVPLQLGIIYFSSNIETRIYEYLNMINSAVNQINLGNVFKKWLKYSDTIDSGTLMYETRDSSHHSDGETIEAAHRPEQVFLRVGFVVLQIQLGYTGVIIGWKLSSDGEPIYEILTSHPKIQGSKTEAPQSSLYPLQYTYIFHPELGKYFEGYDGSTQYIPLPWLKNLYPLD